MSVHSVPNNNNSAPPDSPISYASSLPSSSPPPLCPAILPAEATDSTTVTADPGSATAVDGAGSASLASVASSFAEKDTGSPSVRSDAGALADAVTPGSAAPYVPTSPTSNESSTTAIGPRSGPPAYSPAHDVSSRSFRSPLTTPLTTGRDMLSRGVQTHVMLTKRGKPSQCQFCHLYGFLISFLCFSDG